MIDLLYMLAALPVCAALASISMCRLNLLDVERSKGTWIFRHFLLGVVSAGVGLEALMHPPIFHSPELKILARLVGLGLCSTFLYFSLKDTYRWGGLQEGNEHAPVESNRVPLGD